MEETEFNTLAEATLARIERALDACAADIDYELQAGGVLELEFGDGSKIIINRHVAAREIGVAARAMAPNCSKPSGAWHPIRPAKQCPLPDQPEAPERGSAVGKAGSGSGGRFSL